MAPINPDDPARDEQLRLAKELRRDFQKSGSFKASSSGQGKGNSRTKPSVRNNQPAYINQQAAHRLPPTQAPRHQGYRPATITPSNSGLGRQASSNYQPATANTPKRKMDSMPSDFFGDQGEDRTAAAPTGGSFGARAMGTNTSLEQATSHNASSMGMGINTHSATGFNGPAMTPNSAQSGRSNGSSEPSLIDFQGTANYNGHTMAQTGRTTEASQSSLLDGPAPMMMMSSMQPLQPTMPQNSGMQQAAVGADNSFTSGGRPEQVQTSGPVPLMIANAPVNGRIQWYYQDDNSVPEILPCEPELTNDTEMTDADSYGGVPYKHRVDGKLTVCTCTRLFPARGLGASRWSKDNMDSTENLKIDPKCPYHGTVSSYQPNKGYNGSGGSGNGNGYGGGGYGAAKAPPVLFKGFY